MFWVIRGTDGHTDSDFAMVVEADSRAGAEAWALKRSVPYVIIDEAEDGDIDEARKGKRLWKHTPDARHRCFGQPVGAAHLACLMLCGVWTIALLLTRCGTVSIFC
jgi:hypothetical protein